MINYTDLNTEAIYDYDSGNGRTFQFGKLVTPHPDYPQETHALRIQTPVKDVTFLLNSSDAGWLGLVAYVLNGDQPINERWLKLQLGKVFKVTPQAQRDTPLHIGDMVKVRSGDSPESARFQGIEGKVINIVSTGRDAPVDYYLVSFARDTQYNWLNKPVLHLFAYDELILIARYHPSGYEDID